MSYRVWNAVNIGFGRMDCYEIASPTEARKLIDRLTQEQLHNLDIHSNAFGLEEYENGEWREWYDQEGEDILHSKQI